MNEQPYVHRRADRQSSMCHIADRHSLPSSRSTRSSALFIAALLAAACHAKVEDNPGPQVVEETQESAVSAPQCPRTFALANGATCSSELMCTYTIDCGAVPQQTQCSCVDGQLQRTDRVGYIPFGANQVCAPGALDDSSSCPLSPAIAHGKACGVVGRLCAYRGTYCPVTNTVPLDYCRCSPDGSGGQRFICESQACIEP